MASTVLEELIVTLGLDTSQFTAGQKKAAQALLDTQRAVTSSTDAMGKTLTRFTGQLTAFFLGFEGLKGVIDLVKSTAEEFKQLGITAEIMGTSLREVRTLEEFSELAGGGKGSNQFAQWFQGQRQAMAGMIFGRIPQQFLPSLIGLNPMALSGMDPMAALKQIQAAITSHGPQLQQMLSGLMPGITAPMAEALFANAMGMPAAMQAELANPKHFQTDIKQAQRTNKGVHDAQAEAARRAVNAMIDLRYNVENVATQGFGLLTGATHLLQDAFRDLYKLVEDIINSPLGKWIQSEFSPNGTGTKLLHSTLNMEENYWRGLGNFLMHPWDTLKQDVSGSAHALFQGATPMLSPGAAHAMHGLGAPTASLIGPGGQGGANNAFNIGSISVNTAATDANGIAGSIDAAIQRKFNVTQADTGVMA